MTLEVVKAVWSEERSFGVMPEKTTRAFVPGAPISDRPELQVEEKLGLELCAGSFMPHEYDPEIRTDSVQEAGCGIIERQR